MLGICPIRTASSPLVQHIKPYRLSAHLSLLLKKAKGERGGNKPQNIIQEKPETEPTTEIKNTKQDKSR